MDELEWLKDQKPSARPSRDVTKRHRTQLRAAIATDGAEGGGPRRARRERRSRHRVLITASAVVAACALGIGVVALTSSGGDGGNSVGARNPGSTSTSTTPKACEGAPPKELAIPAGFGNAIAAPAEEASTPPASTQQVTSWSSDQVTIEERWPADPNDVARLGTAVGAGDSISSSADKVPIIDSRGVAHRTIIFTFGSQPPECSNLQVTVYGTDIGAVDRVADGLIAAPFPSAEPLVTTTAAAASAPGVIACEAAVRSDPAGSAVATVGGPVHRGTFAQASAALVDFLPGHVTLAQRGYRELRLADSSVVYAKEGTSGVVTEVHVVASGQGWTVSDWEASGC